jgi:3-hydroxyisobutyrate dehydrogenase
MKVGFIGLGNVGAKLAGSLLRNGHDLMVRDLDPALVAPFLEKGAKTANSPREMMEACELVITCLPSPAICAAVVEGPDGLLEASSPARFGSR